MLASDDVLRLGAILGHESDAALATRLHELAHAGGIEILRVPARDLGRHRLRLASDRGTDCAVAIPRDQALRDGAVLYLDEKRAVVLRVGEERWLRLRARDPAAALELGHRAGHLHWRVRFDGDDLLVAVDGADDLVLARLGDLLDAGRVAHVDA